MKMGTFPCSCQCFPNSFDIFYVRVLICLLARFFFCFVVVFVFGFLLAMKNQWTAEELLWEVRKQAINQCRLVSLGFQIFCNIC